MKKNILLLMCLPIFVLSMVGCQNSSTIKKDNTTDIIKIEDTKEIVIGYGANSFIAIINDQTEIKQLEDLFNGAEFTKSDTSTQQPYLSISFCGKKSSTPFRIDDKDVIQLESGNGMTSEQINFSELHAIFNDYAINKK